MDGVEVEERNGNGLLPAEPTCAREPAPDERLPPRETRTKLNRAATRTPDPNWIGNTPMIESENPTLKPLPTNADQQLPTPSGPTDLKMLSHTFS